MMEMQGAMPTFTIPTIYMTITLYTQLYKDISIALKYDISLCVYVVSILVRVAN